MDIGIGVADGNHRGRTNKACGLKSASLGGDKLEEGVLEDGFLETITREWRSIS